MRMTIRELAKKIGMDEMGARGFVMFLENAGVAKVVGKRLNDGQSRGKPANDYEIDTEEASDYISRVLTDLDSEDEPVAAKGVGHETDEDPDGGEDDDSAAGEDLDDEE